MKRKTTFTLIAFLTLFSFSFTHEYKNLPHAKDFLNEKELEWLNNHQVITLAPDPQFAPFEFFDENGNYQGIGAEYAKVIEDMLAIKFEILHYSNWSDVIRDFKAGKIDILNTMFSNYERTEYMLFPPPYLEIPSVILARKGEISSDLKIEQIGRYRITMVKDYGMVYYITNRFPGYSIYLSSNIKEALLKVSTGKADVFLCDLATIEWYVRESGFQNLEVVAEFNPPTKMGFGIRKDLWILNNIIREAQKNVPKDLYRAILKKWITLDLSSQELLKNILYGVKIFLAVFLLIILFFHYANYRLKRIIKEKTLDLQKELETRKKTEKELKEALSEKNLLIREIHHRVKNNFNIIVSLLNLQKDKAIDKNIKDAIGIAQNRMFSMALIHEMLYQTNQFASVSINAYIEKLLHHVQEIYKDTYQRISFNLDIKDITLPMDIAIPCGMIINEILMNSLKYAFPDNRKGSVFIKVKKEKENIFINIGDDGVGLPSGEDPFKKETLGMVLIQSLVYQLRGIISYKNENGLSFEIVIPAKMDNKG